MEAHLSQYHHIDIRDRDIRDEHGRRKLTLAMIAARILEPRPEGSPIDTALNGGVRPPSRVELMLSDLFQAQKGVPNPRLLPAEEASPEPGRNPEREALKRKRSQEARERAEKRNNTPS
ncbi:hypothetical protein GS966_20000 [Rhodococcus hoagii]|nr:hypothetical protein [Prescottella equi]NKS73138.1 hypothetical protein [Prescottella equi]NKZ92210.1 hypothetical protein [Prescottella equi]